MVWIWGKIVLNYLKNDIGGLVGIGCKVWYMSVFCDFVNLVLDCYVIFFVREGGGGRWEDCCVMSLESVGGYRV